jgi:hypothetical protein
MRLITATAPTRSPSDRQTQISFPAKGATIAFLRPPYGVLRLVLFLSYSPRSYYNSHRTSSVLVVITAPEAPKGLKHRKSKKHPRTSLAVGRVPYPPYARCLSRPGTAPPRSRLAIFFLVGLSSLVESPSKRSRLKPFTLSTPQSFVCTIPESNRNSLTLAQDGALAILS